jgi:hypothetical protein
MKAFIKDILFLAVAAVIIIIIIPTPTLIFAYVTNNVCAGEKVGHRSGGAVPLRAA